VRSLITFFVLCIAVAAWPQPVPGTRVALTPPDGFVPATEFPGFTSEKIKANIAVSETPAPFLELNDAYSDAGLRKKGIVVRDRETIERDGLRGVIITGDEPNRTRAIVKIIMLTGDDEQSLIITSTFFKADEARIADDLRQSLRNVDWDGGRVLDHFDGLGFRLKEIPGLQVATRVSNSIIFTRNGRLPDEFYTGQMLIVGWSKGDKSTIKALQPFALARFNDIQLLNNITVRNATRIELDGVSGVEVVGRGTHRSLGYDVAAFQVLLDYPDRLLLAQGFSNTDKLDATYDQFRTILSTLSTSDDP